MKILIYTPYALDNNSTPVLLDEALTFLEDPAHQVVVVTCQGELKPCLTNAEQSVIRCAECRFSMNLMLRRHQHPRMTYDTLTSFVDSRSEAAIERHQFQYDSLRQVKAIEWEGVNIGLGVVSTYVTMTRNLNPALNEANRDYLDASLRAEARLVTYASRMLDTHKPDLVCLFNGRFGGLRPVLELAKRRGVQAKVSEYTFTTTFEEVRKVEFYNAMPQDFDHVAPIIEDTWHCLPADTREEVATRFYERRRNGQPASDLVYAGKQQGDLLPANWDTSKRNFVIFNSSEDEFFAIGEAVEQYKIFEDQMEGVRFLARTSLRDPSVRLYLRVHPNLSKIPYSYHTSLAALADEFPNLTVISATSKVSTYKLIDACEKVFVFGSTAGVEATFWGKPVVLMGGALYLHLDVAYRAKSLAELEELMFAELTPKPRIGALKYALFIFGERGKPYKYVNFNNRVIDIRGKVLLVPRCYELFGSMVPYMFVIAFFRLLNGISHAWFKKVVMKRIAVEMPPPARDAVPVASRGDGISAVA